MRGLKSSATIQQEHVIQLMAVPVLNLLHGFCACDVLKVYVIWQVSNFIKIVVLPLQATLNWHWQGIITVQSMCFFATWQPGVLLSHVNHWLSFCIGGVEMCAIFSQTRNHPLDLLKNKVSLYFQDFLHYCFFLLICSFVAVGEGLFFCFLVLTRTLEDSCLTT